MKIDLKANEQVIKAGSSKFINGKTIEGKLVVTNQRIYFVATDYRNNDYNQEIKPVNIKEVMPFNTLAFIENGLNVVTKEGIELKFKVKNRKSWELLINKMY